MLLFLRRGASGWGDECDGCGVCDEVCVAVRYVGRILEG